MPEIIVRYAGGQNKVVIIDPNARPIGGIDKDILLFLVHPGDCTEDYGGVLLFSNNGSNRPSDLAWSQDRGCHLVKKRLKNVVVVPIDEGDVHRGFSQLFRRVEAGKSTADDDYMGNVISHDASFA